MRTSAFLLAAALLAPRVLEADPLPRDARAWVRDDVSITFDVPESYGDCRPGGLKGTVLTHGVPDNWRLAGRVNLGYVRDGQFVVLQTIQIDQRGDLTLEIFYPPHSAIVAHTHGLLEYHVEPQIEVYDAGGARAAYLGGDLPAPRVRSVPVAGTGTCSATRGRPTGAGARGPALR